MAESEAEVLDTNFCDRCLSQLSEDLKRADTKLARFRILSEIDSWLDQRNAFTKREGKCPST